MNTRIKISTKKLFALTLTTLLLNAQNINAKHNQEYVDTDNSQATRNVSANIASLGTANDISGLYNIIGTSDSGGEGTATGLYAQAVAIENAIGTPASGDGASTALYNMVGADGSAGDGSGSSGLYYIIGTATSGVDGDEMPIPSGLYANIANLGTSSDVSGLYNIIGTSDSGGEGPSGLYAAIANLTSSGLATSTEVTNATNSSSYLGTAIAALPTVSTIQSGLATSAEVAALPTTAQVGSPTSGTIAGNIGAPFANNGTTPSSLAVNLTTLGTVNDVSGLYNIIGTSDSGGEGPSGLYAQIAALPTASTIQSGLATSAEVTTLGSSALATSAQVGVTANTGSSHIPASGLYGLVGDANSSGTTGTSGGLYSIIGTATSGAGGTATGLYAQLLDIEGTLGTPVVSVSGDIANLGSSSDPSNLYSIIGTANSGGEGTATGLYAEIANLGTSNDVSGIYALFALIQMQNAANQVVSAANSPAIATTVVGATNASTFNGDIVTVFTDLATAMTSPNNSNITTVQSDITTAQNVDLSGGVITSGYSSAQIAAGLHVLQAAVANWLAFYQ